MCKDEEYLKMLKGAEEEAHTICPLCTITRGKGEHGLHIKRPPICLGMAAYYRYIALKTDIKNYYECLKVTDYGDNFTVSI